MKEERAIMQVREDGYRSDEDKWEGYMRSIKQKAAEMGLRKLDDDYLFSQLFVEPDYVPGTLPRKFFLGGITSSGDIETGR